MDDFDSFSPTDKRIEKYLLKFDPLFLSFSQNQPNANITEFNQEIFEKNFVRDRTNVFFFINFEFLLSLLSLLIQNIINNFTFFLTVRMFTVGICLVYVKFMYNEKLIDYRKVIKHIIILTQIYF